MAVHSKREEPGSIKRKDNPGDVVDTPAEAFGEAMKNYDPEDTVIEREAQVDYQKDPTDTLTEESVNAPTAPNPFKITPKPIPK